MASSRSLQVDLHLASEDAPESPFVGEFRVAVDRDDHAAHVGELLEGQLDGGFEPYRGEVARPPRPRPAGDEINAPRPARYLQRADGEFGRARQRVEAPAPRSITRNLSFILRGAEE